MTLMKLTAVAEKVKCLLSLSQPKKVQAICPGELKRGSGREGGEAGMDRRVRRCFYRKDDTVCDRAVAGREPSSQGKGDGRADECTSCCCHDSLSCNQMPDMRAEGRQE